jgi:hypothetical protein
MNSNKNIDRLFQERLKNLEVTPNKRVWKGIESKITKKKRTVFPFWWLSSGIAALFIVGLLLFPFDDSNQQFKQNIPEKTITKSPKKSTNPFLKETSKTRIVEKKEVEVNQLNEKSIIKKQQNNTLVIQVNPINKEEKEISNNNLLVVKNQSSIKEESLVIIEEFTENKKESKVTIAKNTENSTIIKDSKKIDIKKAIEEHSEKIKKKNSDKKNWSIAPVFAVLNSNSFTDSSPIHNSLAGSTRGKNSVSFGVQITYQLNKKWAIQSGLHLQEIRYGNNQIAVISSSMNASNITFNSEENFAFESISNTSLDISSSPLKAISLEGELTQNYSYYEVPLEVKYHLIGQNKFKTHLIGGFSTLFLKENQIRLSTSTLSKEGEANNLNNINFSGNLGLDFNYNLNANWSMHINPMFKTQFNTFNDSANKFQPYSIGLYTGVYYQF